MLTGLVLRQGGLFLPASLCNAHLAGADGAVLQRDGADLLVIPVLRTGGGGCLLKQYSSAGDKVIDAGPFFSDHGLGDEPVEAAASWDAPNERLVVHGVFSAAEQERAADAGPIR